MSQPLDRTCRIEPLGDIDEAAGEFWSHPFEMPRAGHNLSAYERNRLFLNVDGRTFLDASFASAADLDSDSRSAMIGDFSGDGAPDLLVGSVGGGPLRLFRNRMNNHRRVELRLVGVESNRSGIGARVHVSCNERRMIRDLFAANGFMGQSPAQLHLGLGQAEQIDELSIRWPSGMTQNLAGVPVNGIVTIVEGRNDFQFEPFRRSSSSTERTD